MRLNLKKGLIKKIGDGKYLITYDISKMNKPRLTQEARMYIEYLNLPEFVDDTWGEQRGHNRGRLEIYCDNLEDDNYEQDDGYGTQTLLYSSPLKSFDSFRNSDPLKISNFKIRSNFLRDQIVLTLCIYDQFGIPYTRVMNREQGFMSSLSSTYYTYNNKVNEYAALQELKEKRESEFKSFIDAQAALDSQETDFKTEMETAHDELMQAIDRDLLTITDTFLELKLSLFKQHISGIGDDDHVNYVLELRDKLLFSSNKIDDTNAQLDQFTDKFRKYQSAKYQALQNRRRAQQYASTNPNVIDKETFAFSAAYLGSVVNKTIKSEAKSVPYNILNNAGTSIGAGDVNIEYFNRKDGNFVIVNSMKATNGAPASFPIDLTIKDTNFEQYFPETFEWTAGKIDGRNRTAQQNFIDGYVLEEIKIVNAGDGYNLGVSVNPDITISAPPAGAGNRTATAEAVVVNGKIDEIVITDFGSGYLSAPNVIIDPAPPTDALATTEITAGTVTNINVVFGGRGYTAIPNIIIEDAPSVGTRATAEAVLNADGVVTTINITDAGSGYTTAPTIQIDLSPVRSQNATLEPNQRAFTDPAKRRFIFKIEKVVGNTDYVVAIQNDVFPSAGFNKGDKIKLDGEQFGGKSGLPTANGNDLTITITDIETVRDDHIVQNIAFDRQGDFKFELTHEQATTGQYINFAITANNTENYSVGEEIVIPYNLLNGADDTHNLKLTVDSIYEKEREYNFNESKIVHKIEPKRVTKDGNPLVVISDASGNEKTDKTDYDIEISSINGAYTFEVKNRGKKFLVDDTIFIPGEYFGGKNGEPAADGNDIKFKVKAVVPSTGAIAQLTEIDEAGAETASVWIAISDATPKQTLFWKSRKPNTIQLTVKTNNNSNVYAVLPKELIYLPLESVRNGDTFVVLGDNFLKVSDTTAVIPAAHAVLNKLEISIKDVDPATTASRAGTPPVTGAPPDIRQALISDIDIAVIGTAPVEPAPIGRLRDLGFTITKAQGKLTPNVGKIKAISVSGTHVVDPDPPQSLIITLTENTKEGIAKIENDISAKLTEVDAAQLALQPTKTIFHVQIDETKLQNLNMGLVLYNEIPEYTQASADAIIGNTYSRLVNNQFKRI